MIDLLIYILVMLIVFGLIYWVITLLPLPYPFGLIAQIVVAVILLLVLLSLIGVVPRGPLLR